MNKLVTICFAGLMFIGTGRAAQNDAGAEQRFRAKFGRSTPMEETRQRASMAQAVTSPVSSARVALHDDGGAEQRFRAKYGRNTPAEEARQRASKATLQANTSNAAAPLATSDAGFEVRFREKFGGSSPLAEARLKAPGNSTNGAISTSGAF
jgi:hypothetical protein